MKYLFIVLLLITTQASATGFYCCKQGPQGEPGPQGEQGPQGIQGETGQAGTNGQTDYAGIVQAAAIGMIPSITHRGKGHSHTSIGFGATSYHSDAALAIGLQNQTESWTFKGALSLSDGSKPMLGAGANYSF